MSDFSAGFAAKHDAAAEALHQRFTASDTPRGFVPADLKAHASGRKPKSFSPAANPPKHFSPANPDSDPTKGWDPLDAQADSSTNAFIDPVETARAAGFAEGLAQARQLAGEKGEQDRALLASLAAALDNAGRLDRDLIARKLRQTVLHLVNRLVGEVGISAELLAKRIVAAVDLLADSTEATVLRVNPDDIALLADKLPATLHPVADAMIDCGSFTLESASTIVEDGPEQWLEQLAQAIDRVAVPPSC
ncbi:MAG: FliH/SctL family protein [Sphingomonas sp.]|jgi:flagellar assembly protein FliH